MKVVVFCLLAFTTASFGMVMLPCEKNEVYKTCGTACPPTCENPKPEVCTDQCVRGCFCNDGYVKNSEGLCVLPSNCTLRNPRNITILPPGNECGKNEIFTNCGTACPPSCENPEPGMCTMQCVVGCQCANGTLRNAEGECVLESECSLNNSTESSSHMPPNGEQCGKNEVYNECGSMCAPTCEKNKPPMMCPAVCIPGCFCSKGTIRNAQGECVPETECPLITRDSSSPIPPNNGEKCGKNEIYEECGSACAPTCENPKPPMMCTDVCFNGCQCTNGTMRNTVGECVPPHLCSKSSTDSPGGESCGENEIYQSCGTACPPTCTNPKPQMCTMQCVEGCFCTNGTLRNTQGKCVPPIECKRIIVTDPIIDPIVDPIVNIMD